MVATKPIMELTAGDVMTRELVCLSQDVSMQEAARVLVENRISGAPVVNAQGKCVGVISSSDFVALANLARMPVNCGFQSKHKVGNGRSIATCTLPFDACPHQRKQVTPDGREIVACVQPYCVCTEWEVVEMDDLPAEAVRQFMTADPVMVPPTMSVGDLARRMIDAHIHRLIVVDAQQKPLGIVSSTDLLAALAYAEDRADL
jgi:CBS domain-containing protein